MKLYIYGIMDQLLMFPKFFTISFSCQGENIHERKQPVF